MDSFVVLKFLSSLALPPALTVVALIVALLLVLLRFRRLGLTVAALALLLSSLIAVPPVADALIRPIEREARQAARQAKPCCYAAIVLLGGAVVPAAPPAMPAAHLVEGADRIFEAARLFHRGVAPRVIVSGGRVEPRRGGESEAQAMKDLLVELGVPADSITLEDRSRNTLDNIAFVHDMVGDQPVALVTSAYHMPRALRAARQVGMEASAFPTDWRVPLVARPVWEKWMPDADAERISILALREYLAAAFDYRRADKVGRANIVATPGKAR